MTTADMQPERLEGTVFWFNPSLGYGFIFPDEPTKDQQQVFVHYNQIQMEGFKKLHKNERVEFTLIDAEGKDQAQNVVPLGTQAQFNTEAPTDEAPTDEAPTDEDSTQETSDEEAPAEEVPTETDAETETETTD